MRRTLFMSVSGLSLLLWLATVVLWVMSYGLGGGFDWSGRFRDENTTAHVWLFSGRIYVSAGMWKHDPFAKPNPLIPVPKTGFDFG
jgi:hypothetical protein